MSQRKESLAEFKAKVIMAKVKKEEQYKKMTWMERRRQQVRIAREKEKERRNLVKEKKDSLEFLRKIKE